MKFHTTGMGPQPSIRKLVERTALIGSRRRYHVSRWPTLLSG